MAVAANVGKVAVYQGNPLAINCAVWLPFVLAAFQFAHGRVVPPTDLLIRQGLGNADALDRGWPELDADASGFPNIVL